MLRLQAANTSTRGYGRGYLNINIGNLNKQEAKFLDFNHFAIGLDGIIIKIDLLECFYTAWDIGFEIAGGINPE